MTDRSAHMTNEAESILSRWQRSDHIQLHAGEMTAQELRSVKAVVKAIEYELTAARPAPHAGLVEREAIALLQAIADGYIGKVEHGYLMVENPEATPESIALGGLDPNLVVSADAILVLLSTRPVAGEPVARRTDKIRVNGTTGQEEWVLETTPAPSGRDPATIEACEARDASLLMRLRDDNRAGEARPVIESSQWEWDQAMRLSDAGMIAIEQIAQGGRLHITRAGAKALRRFLAIPDWKQDQAETSVLPPNRT